MTIDRRSFLKAAGALGAYSLGGSGARAQKSGGRVVVVGGGFAGATAAKYLRLWSGGSIAVTLIEPGAEFVSCPMSNLVLGGSKSLADVTTSYDALEKRHGIRIVRDSVAVVDEMRRDVRTNSGMFVQFDRLIVATGVEFLWSKVPGLNTRDAQAAIPHAWKAGPQTLELRRQLEAMPDGGVCAITIPAAPFRCPPGPYERACQIAWYFKRAKPRSKVLIFDANPDVISKPALFKKAWAELYKDQIEYRPDHVLVNVSAKARTLKFEMQESIKVDVLNVIPPQGAGGLANLSGLLDESQRWCAVDFLTMESPNAANVHVIGDAIRIAPGMPKSGHMANQHAKVCAAAIVELLAGRTPNPAPVMTNTCYSMVSDKEAIHVASVHQYDAEKKTMMPVAGAGGVSTAMSEVEGAYAMAWARNIWADMLG